MGNHRDRWAWIVCLALVVGCGDDDTSADPDTGTEPPADGGGTSDAGGDSGVGDRDSGTGDPDSGTGSDGDGDFTIGPEYSDAPEYAAAAEAPQGVVQTFEIPSNEATHFTTDVETGEPFTRVVNVWIPEQHVSGETVPFIVLQDGSDYVYDLVPALQALIHQGRIPVLVAIAVDAAPGGAVGQRNLEYDTLSEEYVSFVEDDVLPRVRERYSLELTSDPEGRAAMGGSSGGAAAFTMGWFRPDLYRRILTYSGTFVNQRPDATYPRSAWEYHEHLIGETEPKPLRVFLEAGENDFDWNTGDDVYHGWLEANRAMAAALAERGYSYRFIYARGAEHVDNRVIRETLPSALEWLWRGYPRP
ncbi:MAG: hypothetical protein IT379_24680 [Deltaproteobacteria bacterium]|nr:hypothetical protein [Deltaproteobacteria bacterium]